MYSDVQCKIKFGNIETDYFEIEEGVKQGCVLSPILFCIYINELSKLLDQHNLGVKMSVWVVYSGLMT